MKLRDIGKYVLKAIGIMVGMSHFSIGIKAMFVMHGDEPTLLTLIIIAGPLSTLPAIIVSFFRPKVGSTWLIIGSILSLVFVIVLRQAPILSENIIRFGIKYSVPMFILGMGITLLEKSTRRAGRIEKD